jgi:hypothetical protein
MTVDCGSSANIRAKAVTLRKHLPDTLSVSICYLRKRGLRMQSIAAISSDLLPGKPPDGSATRRPAGPLDALLCDMNLPYTETFYPIGYPIEIVTNEPLVLIAARESFGHARLARNRQPLRVRFGVCRGRESAFLPEPTRREFNHLYSLVADGENQALLDLKTGANFTWLTQAAIENRIYFRHNFLEKVAYLLLGASVVTDIHAACVSRNGKGVLLCGDSGAGKSTLAYACARQGWVYTSDDTSYLINDSAPPRVIGHCHRARFRPTAPLLFPELAGRPLTPRMEGKPSIEVPIAELPVARMASESTVDAIVYLKRYAGAVARLDRLPTGTATKRLCKELYSAGEIRARHEKNLEKLWEIPAHELEYSDWRDAVRMLDRVTGIT